MHTTNLALTFIAGSSPAAPAADRQAAAAVAMELSAFVIDIARRVHARHNYLRTQPAQDFVQETPGYVAGVLLQHYAAFHARIANPDRSADPAGGFIFTTVQNHYLSLARKRVPVQLTGGRAADGNSSAADSGDPFDRRSGVTRHANGAHAIDDLDLLTAPLPAADRATLDAWRPIDAVVLLVLSGLHGKVDAPTWNGWLDHCGVGGPIPSMAMLDLPEAKRRDRLAVDLSLTRNGLDQIWSRKRDRLADLEFVGRLRREHRSCEAA